MRIAYLDYAAATPLDPRVLKAMLPYFAENFYNPSAQYQEARDVKKDLEAKRELIAHWLGCRPAEVFFTAGGTEANNFAIHGIMRQYPDANVVVSSIEHDSVLKPAKNYACTEAPVLQNGVIDLQQLQQTIDEQTVLVSIMYANNEIGTIQPLKKISSLLAEVRRERKRAGNPLPIFLHTDASQAANYLSLQVARLGVDLMTINGGKIYGPKQSGVLYVKSHVQLAPQILGGGQERNLRSGTENIAGNIGMATAFDLVQRNRNAESRRLTQLRSSFISQLKEHIPGIIVNGSLKHRLPNNVHVTIPGQDNERLVILLNDQGILCAAGSACSAGSGKPSHVLEAIGLTEEEMHSSLRLTMGVGTDEAVIARVVKCLQSCISR